MLARAFLIPDVSPPAPLPVFRGSWPKKLHRRNLAPKAPALFVAQALFPICLLSVDYPPNLEGQKMTQTKSPRLMALARILPALLLMAIVALNPDIVSASSTPGFGTANTEIINESCSLLLSIKKWLFNVVYILGAIGLVIIAVSAFLGRFKFSHLIALGGGLFIVAAADLLIDFMTAGEGKTTC